MASYAFGGDGAPGSLGLEFARPIPLHALRAHEAAARLAQRSTALRDLPLTTDVGRPPPRPDLEPPKGALDLVKLAEAHGFRTQILRSPDLVTVEGMHDERRVGFRAHWTAAGADGGTWHAAWRYVFVHDERPVRVDKTARVGLKGARSAGMSEHRLSIAASPKGVKTNVTEIRKRIAS